MLQAPGRCLKRSRGADAPALGAEVDLDHIPELQGEIERLRDTPWAPWCSMRSCSSGARWLSWSRSS